MLAADLRLSETDSRPILEPREGRVDVVLGFTGAGVVPGVVPGETEGGLRCGRDEEEDDERDGGRELISGHILTQEPWMTMRVERSGASPARLGHLGSVSGSRGGGHMIYFHA